VTGAIRTKTVCLLGGTGFLGSRLAGKLAGQGHRIRIPTRSRARNPHLLVAPEVTLIQTDIHQPGVLDQLFEGCDVIINLVGILNERGRNGSGFSLAHTQLAEKIVAACACSNPGKLIQISALRANADLGPSHYLRTKGEAERIITTSNMKTSWTILQPSVIFGPVDSFTNRFASLLRYVPLLPLAMPDARFAPVHIDDVVEAIIVTAFDRATDRRTFQLCGPQSFALGDLVRMIRRSIGSRTMVLGLPQWLSRIQAAIMDFVPGKPFSTDNYLSLTVPSLCTENGLEQLGIQARSFEKNLHACLGEINCRSDLDRFRRVAGRV